MSNTRLKKIDFHVQYLKRDYLRIAEALTGEMPYFDDGDPTFEPDHYDGGRDARSSVAIMQWEDHWPSINPDAALHELAHKQLVPQHYQPEGWSIEDLIPFYPWIRENELTFVPFTGWYHTDQSGPYCFAGYRHEVVICPANPGNFGEPADSETNSQPGQRYMELYKANDAIFQWFHENCEMAGLLTYDEAKDPIFQPPPEPKGRSNFGAIHSQHWKQLPRHEMAYDPDVVPDLKIPDEDLFAEAYERHRKSRLKVPAQTKTKRRRKRKRR